MPNIDTKTILLENGQIAVLGDQYSDEMIRADYMREKEDIVKSLEMEKTVLSEGDDWDSLPESEQTRLMIEQQKKHMADVQNATRKYDQELALLDSYGDSFRYLYKIKKENPLFLSSEDYQLEFVEIEQTSDNGGILNIEDHVRMSANNNDSIRQIALHVDMGEDFPSFYLTMPKSDHNEARVKAQIVMDAEDLSSFETENAALSQRNAEIIKRMMQFCEAHGLSTVDFDVPYAYDGSVDGNELYDRYRRRLDAQAAKTSEDVKASFSAVKNDVLSSVEQNSRNQTREREVLRRQAEEKGIDPDAEEYSPDPVADRYISCAAFLPNKKGNAPSNKAVQNVSSQKLLTEIEDFLENGLGKRKGLSYWKKQPLLQNWDAEYIVFDRENQDNFKNYKRNNSKGKYSFRLCVRTNKDGSLDICYMTQDTKPLDESIINGLAGHLKALGVTHVNFPKGLSDREKGIWRKALAEQGLIPLGIGLDRSKISAMLDAAKKKLSDEEYYDYEHRLALQVAEDYKKKEAKGKKVPASEWEYIQAKLMTYQYKNFATTYNDVLKGKITRIVHPKQETENGAIDKIAAFRNLRKVFDVYKEQIQNGHTMSAQEITELYDKMFVQSRIEAKKMLDEKFNEAGPKRADEVVKSGVFSSVYNNCKSMVKELKSLGVDGIELPEATSELPYISPRREQQAPANAPVKHQQSTYGEPPAAVLQKQKNENGL